MVCPQCKASYAQRLHCPQCDVRLHYAEGAARGKNLFTLGDWQQTPWGRVFIGLLLAQGLYYGLRQLCVAALLATGAVGKEELWSSLGGQILLQSLQAGSLCIGALFAGAGQRHGFLYGAVLGAWNGAFVVLVQPAFIWTEAAQFLNAVTVYGQPLLQGALGGLAGWVGSRIWRPLTPFGERDPLRKPVKGARRHPLNLFAGPVHWGRVALGTGLAVGGTLSAGKFLELVIQASDYRLSPDSALQAQLVTWEITALAMLAGSAVAGATTRNGFKQGLAVGLATATVLFGIRLGGTAYASLPAFLLAVGGPVALGIAGGGFGGQLLPPLPNAPRRKAFETP